MRLLLIDVGNTAIHWVIKESDLPLGVMQRHVYKDVDIASLMTQHWTAIMPTQAVVICSVAGDVVNTRIRQWFLNSWDVLPQFIVSPERGYGIQNAYAEAARLGADRWAAMVAAFHLSEKACCVLDCGTAVTFDIVEAGGRHLGGWIMPGYRLFQQSLLQETKAISLSGDASMLASYLGQSTRQCVDIAWHHGVVGLVQRTLTESGLESVKCFVTGGDARRLQALLGEGWCYSNDLVLQGLALMALQD